CGIDKIVCSVSDCMTYLIPTKETRIYHILCFPHGLYSAREATATCWKTGGRSRDPEGVNRYPGIAPGHAPTTPPLSHGRCSAFWSARVLRGTMMTYSG